MTNREPAPWYTELAKCRGWRSQDDARIAAGANAHLLEFWSFDPAAGELADEILGLCGALGICPEVLLKAVSRKCTLTETVFAWKRIRREAAPPG